MSNALTEWFQNSKKLSECYGYNSYKISLLLFLRERDHCMNSPKGLPKGKGQTLNVIRILTHICI
jgi:hypothetical protein